MVHRPIGKHVGTDGIGWDGHHVTRNHQTDTEQEAHETNNAGNGLKNDGAHATLARPDATPGEIDLHPCPTYPEYARQSILAGATTM
jgi:hypothetical protein